MSILQIDKRYLKERAVDVKDIVNEMTAFLNSADYLEPNDSYFEILTSLQDIERKADFICNDSDKLEIIKSDEIDPQILKYLEAKGYRISKKEIN